MTTELDFPFIYCNGDSYLDENYSLSLLLGKTCVDFVASHYNGFAMNKAISGSCNRRIIRTTVHDMIEFRKLNPTQPAVAIIGLSFEIRAELWIEELTNDRVAEETNFRTHVFSKQLNWRENLLSDKSMETPNKYNLFEKYFDMYSKGRAYFYSPYAERINLLCDLVMLRSVLDSLNIKFLVFPTVTFELLGQDYLLDFFKNQLSNDQRFFNFEEFSFRDWCKQQNKFTPLDKAYHYGPDAHQAFAQQVILPRIQELKFL